MSIIHFNFIEKIALFWKGVWPAMCLICLLAGPILYQIGGGKDALLDLQFRYKEVEKEWGYITEKFNTEESSATGSYQFNFSFPVGLETHYGTAYMVVGGYDFNLDQKVRIEYIKGNPDVARIENLKLAHNGSFTYMGIVMVMIAILYIPFRIRWLIGTLKMLENGQIVLATFDSMSKTGVIIYHEEQHELSYKYKVDSKPFFYKIKTIETSGLERTVELLHLSDDPLEVIPFSRLPGSVAQKAAVVYHKQQATVGKKSPHIG